MHVVVINPFTAGIEVAKVFDTHETSEELEEFIAEGIPEGYIVAAACDDDCVTELSTKGQLWFDSMGSRLIWTLGYR